MLIQTRDNKIVFNDSRCCQCGVCIGACPQGAITAHAGRGRYELRIDRTKCNNCGLCVKICPAYAVPEARLSEDTLARATGFYLGAARDARVRHYASSGGVARILLCNAMAQYNISAVYTLLFPNVALDGQLNLVSVGGEAVGTWATSPPDVFRIPTSLYRPILWGAGLRKGLPGTGRVLLVGLPCQIRGARTLLGHICPDVDPVCVSLFCRKTKDFGYSRYILQMAHCEHEPIQHVLYRGEGWPGRFRVLSDGRINDIGPFFYHARCWNAAGCRYCTDCIGSGISDLTLGDPWGIVDASDRQTGMTLVYAWTRKGQELLDSCREFLDMRPLTIGQVERHFDIHATRAREAMVRRRMRTGTLRSLLPFEGGHVKSWVAEHLLSFHPHSRIMKFLLRNRTILKDHAE